MVNSFTRIAIISNNSIEYFGRFSFIYQRLCQEESKLNQEQLNVSIAKHLPPVCHYNFNYLANCTNGMKVLYVFWGVFVLMYIEPLDWDVICLFDLLIDTGVNIALRLYLVILVYSRNLLSEDRGFESRRLCLIGMGQGNDNEY